MLPDEWENPDAIEGEILSPAHDLRECITSLTSLLGDVRTGLRELALSQTSQVGQMQRLENAILAKSAVSPTTGSTPRGTTSSTDWQPRRMTREPQLERSSTQTADHPAGVPETSLGGHLHPGEITLRKTAQDDFTSYSQTQRRLFENSEENPGAAILQSLQQVTNSQPQTTPLIEFDPLTSLPGNVEASLPMSAPPDAFSFSPSLTLGQNSPLWPPAPQEYPPPPPRNFYDQSSAYVQSHPSVQYSSPPVPQPTPTLGLPNVAPTPPWVIPRIKYPRVAVNDVEEYKVINSLRNNPGLFNTAKMHLRPGSTQFNALDKSPLQWIELFQTTVYGHYKAALEHHLEPSINHLPVDLLQRLLIAVFDPVARIWLQQTPVASWDQLLAGFKDRFCLRKREVESRLESTRQYNDESLTAFLGRIDTLRNQAELADDWLVNTMRARFQPAIQEMIQRRIASDTAEGKPLISYEKLRRWLEAYEREAVPDASWKRGNGDNTGNREERTRNAPGSYSPRSPGQGGQEGGGQRGSGPRRTRQETSSTNLIQEIIPEESEIPEAVCHLEEIPENSCTAAAILDGPSESRLEEIGSTLAEDGEINVFALKELASQNSPAAFVLMLSAVAEEGLLNIEELQGEPAALATAALLEEITCATTVISPNIEQDDHEEESRKQPDGSTKTVKKRIKGTIKEAVRGLKSSISLPKLLSVDPQMREYLLYCILDVLNAMGSRLKLPPQVRAQNVSAQHWAEHGKRLAGSTPVRYVLPPDVILGHLREALGNSVSELAGQKRNQPETSQEPSTSGSADKGPQTQRKSARFAGPGEPNPYTGHLASVFKVNEPAGCTISKVHLETNPETSLEDALGTTFDKTHQMGRKRQTPYLLLSIDDNLVWGMRDSGSNFSSVTQRTAADLNLWTVDHPGRFVMADGTARNFHGKIQKAKIRLHDRLTIEVENLRVLPGDFNQVIIGSDILAQAGGKELREVGTQRDGNKQFCQIEVGPPRKGFELSLQLHYANPLDVNGGGGLQEITNTLTPGFMEFTAQTRPRQQSERVEWAAPLQRSWAQEYLAEYKYSIEEVEQHLVATLRSGIIPEHQVCPRCPCPHFDGTHMAVKPHATHKCNLCNYVFNISEPGVSNPLAIFGPKLNDQG